MSPPQPDLSEDYIAELLKRDARNTLNPPPGTFESLVSRRPTSGPSTRKPNLRFLNNIIRETDTHNSALKLRELEQAGDRLRKLRGDPPRATGDRRSRHQGNDDPSHHEIDSSGRRRRRRNSDGEHSDDFRSRKGRERRDGRRSRSRSPGEKRRRRDVRDERGYESRRRREDKDGRRSERSDRRRRGKADGDDMDGTSSHKRRDGRSERRYTDESSHERRNRSNSAPETRSRGSDKYPRTSDDRRESRTDKPKDRVGHLDRHDENFGRLQDESAGSVETAPVIRRGRGAHTSRGSAMDARFMPTYDPKMDVEPDAVDGDAEDWERGMDAVRDRARFQKVQGDRLRAAGFSAEEVERWEMGKREEDVKWKSRDEDREWDRGKVIQDDGTVSASAEWTSEAKR